tara:strand:- start:1314 stop:3827 length:2514 start_codon:yes stop_codon:yes gene_type:complete
MANDTPESEAASEAEEKKNTLEPIDYQCVLLENVHRIKREKPKFKRVTILDDPGGNEGTLLSRIQHGERTDEIREILNLCPEVYASLSPYLRLSRVDYKKDNPTIIEKEIPIEIPNFLSETDVEQITKGKIGRTPGAGIKSFSWSLDGVQPAEVDNNITATLVVYFQSLSDFFKGAEVSPGRYAAQRPNKATFLDLIINAPTSRRVGTSNSSKPPNVCKPTGTNLVYDGGGFRIKITAGWSCPDNLATMFPHLANKAGLIKKAIDATKVSLYLQQVRHDLQFNQNGSLTLTATYQAAISGMGTSEKFNILKTTQQSLPPAESAKLDDLLKKLKDKKQGITGNETDSQLESKNKEIDNLLEKINNLQQKDKKLKYQALLDGLYRSDKIRALRVANTELVIPNLDDISEAERQEYFKGRASASADRAKIDSVTGVGSDALKALENPDNESAGDAGSDAEDQVKQKSTPIDRTESTDIHFMYLGDIIDNVLSQIQKNNDITDLDYQIFMQRIKFIDLNKAFQLSDSDLTVLSKCSNATMVARLGDQNLNNIYDSLPISEIPISMDLFQTWFIDRVIKPERNKYYLLHFLKDLTSTLVTNALRAGCYGTKFRIYQRFDIQPINYSKGRPGVPKSVKSLGKAQAKLLKGDEPVKNTRNGMVMFSTDSKGTGLTGNFEKDLKQGIYHQYIGASCGLLKELNFSREEQPYLREAKIQKDGALGAEQLRELFSVDIKMVGNNLFKNGQLTYVNPVLINTTEEQLRLLGLHGYYLITAVKSEVTEGGFTTTLKALQEGIEFPTVPAATQSSADRTDEQSPSDDPAADSSSGGSGGAGPAGSDPAQP